MNLTVRVSSMTRSAGMMMHDRKFFAYDYSDEQRRAA